MSEEILFPNGLVLFINTSALVASWCQQLIEDPQLKLAQAFHVHKDPDTEKITNERQTYVQGMIQRGKQEQNWTEKDDIERKLICANLSVTPQ